eukprot:GFUD01119364.1.p1 GENE.GFUD01119364.1~~GFUD01119364.1.p1  ORF type:complete len:104 (-),score=24.14 GFUD01119364.1:110-385(-)
MVLNKSLHKNVLRERCPSFDRVETNEPFNNTVTADIQPRVAAKYKQRVATDNKPRQTSKSFKQDQFNMNMSLHKQVLRVTEWTQMNPLTTQ